MEPDTSKVNVLVGNICVTIFSGKIRLYAWLDCYLVLCTFSEKGFYTAIDGMDFVCNNNIKKKRTQVSCELGERIWNI